MGFAFSDSSQIQIIINPFSGQGQGRPPAEGATQAPRQTRTPPDKTAQ